MLRRARQALVAGRRPRPRRHDPAAARGRAAAKANGEGAQGEAARPELRFAVGDRVECNMDGWALGVVVRHWYHEPSWPPGQVVPYQVKLDSGMTIFAPYDEEQCIRKAQGILSYGKIPVTVLTGFLGAGKTTLLNYILRAQHGKRYAVIENEVGAVPIDEMLVNEAVGKQSTTESITVLDNGCLCCTLRDDLVEALRSIVETVRQRLDAGVPNAMIDGILIETTGIADPGPICKTFGLDAEVNAHCKIDGILTVVDAVHFLQQLERERPEDTVNEPAQQVAFADKVLLNKVDAVDPARVRETIDAIRGVNTLVPIKECSLAKAPDAVPLDELLSIDAFDATRLLSEDGDAVDLASAEHDQGHDAECSNPECSDPGCSDPACGDSSPDQGAGCSNPECSEPECSDPGCGDATSESKSGCGDATSKSTCGGKASKSGCGDASSKSSTCGGKASKSSCGDASSKSSKCGGKASKCKPAPPPKVKHDTDIGTVLLEMSGSALDVTRFQVFLDQLLSERSVDLYRYKGVLAVDQQGIVVRYVLQGVHDMTEISFSGEWPAGTPVKTQVVIIGRKLDREAWQESFAACAVDAPQTVDA